MKISANTKQMAIAYLHGVVVATLPLLMIGEKDWTKYGWAIVAGVIVPALRALNKKDTAFGMVADAIESKEPKA